MGGRGIYVHRFNQENGELTREGLVEGITNPSFVALDPKGCGLYAVSEMGDGGGESPSTGLGAVSAFAVDRATGALTFLNRQPSEGDGPCHVSVDQGGQFVSVANYRSGSIALLPIDERGALRPATSSVQHEGAGVDPERQEGPHAHSVTLDPANRFAIAADLGVDRLYIYRLDLDEGELRPASEPFVSVAPGSGPRHFAFHPTGAFGYLVNELNGTLVVYEYDEREGTLTELQVVSTLPEGYDGVTWAADVHVHPSGDFVYASNRGHDSLAIFRIDGRTGRVMPQGHIPTEGETPRNFAISPNGRFLLAANQDTDTIVTFAVDPATGALQSTGRVAVPAPVCIKMMDLGAA
jgi:6-phosphogluconolactonase